MTAWLSIDYCTSLIVLVPAVAAGLQVRRFRDLASEKSEAGSFAPYRAMLYAFGVLVFATRLLPARLVPLAVEGGEFVVAWSGGTVALFLVMSPPARRVALPLTVIVGGLDVVALPLGGLGLRSGWGEHIAFKPVFFVALILTAAAGVWVARRLGYAASPGSSPPPGRRT